MWARQSQEHVPEREKRRERFCSLVEEGMIEGYQCRAHKLDHSYSRGQVAACLKSLGMQMAREGWQVRGGDKVAAG